MELCKVQQVTSTEGAYQFISREFEENTKYDYKPGKTPANMDFAEYFLFENKKGFCVHFATTAVLMYRIFEVPARYVEGVAVPASAFEQTEDGRYQAEVTGSMRHAWCETYENGFTVREHTLAYNGPDAEKAGPAADSQRDPISIKRQITEGIVIIIVIVVALIGILLLQSGVRRRHKCKVFRILSDGVGVQQMYLNIYKIGKHQGLSGKEAVSEECFYHLREMYNEIRDEEWDWVRRMVLGILFNRQEPNRKENERMYDIYKKITTMAKKKEKGWRKFQYKYLYCLD